jgi:hypothetical protein
LNITTLIQEQETRFFGPQSDNALLNAGFRVRVLDRAFAHLRMKLAEKIAEHAETYQPPRSLRAKGLIRSQACRLFR